MHRHKYLLSFIFLFLLVGTTCTVAASPVSKFGYNYLNQLNDNYYTGWVEYIDTEYNSTNRLMLSTSKVELPNNAGNFRDSEKPIDVDTFYNGTHILAREPGDSILLRIRFDSEPQANNLYCEITNQIGLPTELKVRNINFPKGIGVEELQTFTNFEYQLDSWKQNGGKLYIECSGDVEIWNIEYSIALLHRGRGIY